jgi:glycerophosphoryl diester phosphodiesterase
MPAPDWLTSRPIAHRGLHDAARGIIENTPSAASAAVAGGYAIECDVQLTADGEAVVFHDFTLDRLTVALGDLDTRSADALGRIALKDTSDRIPTLARFLALIAGRVPLVVEIKSRFDGDLRLTQRTLEVLATVPEHPVAVKSFDPEIVAAVAVQAPHLPRGIVAMSRYDHHDYARLSEAERHAMANLLHYSKTTPDFLSWSVNDLPSGIPNLWRAALGRPVMTWTVRDAQQRGQAARFADQMVFEGFAP